MAHVAILCMNVWQCPHCEVAVKARSAHTVLMGSEYHLIREHDILVTHWDPVIELRHWAYNIRPDDDDDDPDSGLTRYGPRDRREPLAPPSKSSPGGAPHPTHPQVYTHPCG